VALSVALETLGCKVNQCESSGLIETLTAAGYHQVPFKEPAQIYVVHGCAVTARAAYQTRQLLRRARRTNPQATVVSAGCQAQLEADLIATEQLATHVLGNDAKFDILSHLEVSATFQQPHRAVGDLRSGFTFRSLPLTCMHRGRARAFLKVQDGCDAFCSYCIVPTLRGCCRSMPSENVREQLDRFIFHGYREVVLTGIHLGLWGKDLCPPQTLAALLSSLARGPLPHRMRLSSLEPTECSKELMQLIHQSRWICPHFHIPLQSGDAQILAAMHRPYTPDQYGDLITQLHRLFPEAALGADVLVGFPGESVAMFEHTRELLKRLPITYLHAFPYSARPGTAAALLKQSVPKSELKARVRSLRELSTAKRLAFHRKLHGTCLEVLVESRAGEGGWRGTSENYVQVRLPDSPSLTAGVLARATVSMNAEGNLIGRVVAIID
jgi:threonylcarbamoyladenosine tRNA methylthiotransferase MtaB